MTINAMIREMKSKGASYQLISTLIYNKLSPQRIGKIAAITDRECKTTNDIRASIITWHRRLCK